jgi:hypothetical protein
MTSCNISTDISEVACTSEPLPMSVLGQLRHFDSGPAASGLPRSTDIVGASRHVSNVPIAEVFAY